MNDPRSEDRRRRSRLGHLHLEQVADQEPWLLGIPVLTSEVGEAIRQPSHVGIPRAGTLPAAGPRRSQPPQRSRRKLPRRPLQPRRSLLAGPRTHPSSIAPRPVTPDQPLTLLRDDRERHLS